MGESGCGKSTTGRTILRLIEPTSGEVWFQSKNVTTLDKRALRALEQGAAVAESRFRQTAVLCSVAIALSLVAFGFSLVAFF